MFRIGEFSKLVRVSPRMLRHYEKCGLLYPAEIDKFTGYRQYSAGQIPLLGNIVSLRDVGFSIDEIKDTLPRFDDYAYMDRVLRIKLAEAKEALSTEQEKLNRLMQMSGTVRKERKIMVFDVELRKLPSVKVLSLRGIIPRYRDEGMLWEKLGTYAAKKQIAATGGGYSTYFDEEYKEIDPDVEIAIPVDELGESDGEFVYKEYPEIPQAATARFSGPFDGGYDAACEKLAKWMEAHGYAFAGPLRGHVTVPPSEDSNPEDWMTELQAPVVKK
ncbi:MAG: MerR family transcriptional regulator [Clostridiales bacterium]|nr:MerR family transcriptional regulator [Clostridiales bacterium]